jgi:hypothetical protein
MSNGFSDATKAGIAVVQRLGGARLDIELCPWCKLRPADEVDHIQAKANGGSNSVFNGMYICKPCNRQKSAMLLEDWIELVRKREHVADIEVWLRSKDKADYYMLIGRKLRKDIGWRPTTVIVEDAPAIVPRPNPKDAINKPVMEDVFYYPNQEYRRLWNEQERARRSQENQC